MARRLIQGLFVFDIGVTCDLIRRDVCHCVLDVVGWIFTLNVEQMLFMHGREPLVRHVRHSASISNLDIAGSVLCSETIDTNSGRVASRQPMGWLFLPFLLLHASRQQEFSWSEKLISWGFEFRTFSPNLAVFSLEMSILLKSSFLQVASWCSDKIRLYLRSMWNA